MAALSIPNSSGNGSGPGGLPFRRCSKLTAWGIGPALWWMSDWLRNIPENTGPNFCAGWSAAWSATWTS